MILKSSGQQYRNFIPLSDLCAIIHYFIKNDKFKELYNVFNLGSDFTAKVIDIAELIRCRCIEVFKMKQIKIKFEKYDFEKTMITLNMILTNYEKFIKILLLTIMK